MFAWGMISSGLFSSGRQSRDDSRANASPSQGEGTIEITALVPVL
jgi:hypothetical protein